MWELSPPASWPEPASYCFTCPGTYSVGRKACAICIPDDKAVSRSHGEIVVEPLPPWNGGESRCRILVRDLSKFGTFVNKTSNDSKPVLSFPGKQLELHDGDEVTFGVTTFRLKHRHFFFCMSPTSEAITQAAASFGAYCLGTWDPSCTHVLVQDGSPVTELVLKAVEHKKPVISSKWLEAIAFCSCPCRDLPDTSGFLPTLTFTNDGSAQLVQIVEPRARQAAFWDTTFLAAASTKYRFKEDLRSLVEAAGGTFERVPSRGHSSPSSRPRHAFIVPPDTSERELQAGLEDVRRIREADLVQAILSGQSVASAFYLPERHAESQSTEVTVDLRDTEDDADSVEVVKSTPVDEGAVSPSEEQLSRPQSNHSRELSPSQDLQSDHPRALSPGQDIQPSDPSPSPGKDFSLASDLQEVSFAAVVKPSTPELRNFKAFRRVGAVSGNSFQYLVPFAEEPYREAAQEQELLRAERKRKAREKQSDELFERDDLKRTRTKAKESMFSILY